MTGKFLLAILLCATVFVILAQALVFSDNAPRPVELAQLHLRDALWNMRMLDVVGQLGLLFTATYGVLVLAKENT